MEHVERFEPVFLVPDGPAKITEHGKRWLDKLLNAVAKSDHPPMMGGITSGISQYAMPKLVDHLNGKTSFTMPATVTMALATTAPTSTTTGATVVEPTYTGYGRQTLAGAVFGAATAATPSVSTSASTITFGAVTAGGPNTLLGFIIADNATTGAGNALWYGTLASTVVSTTQTPPTVPAGSLTFSLTGT